MKKSLKIFWFLAIFVCCGDLNPHSEALFSPDDHPAKRLIQVIDATQRKIYAAIYMFTDGQIADALIRAKKRGVAVEVVVDKATVDYEYGKAKVLKENGIKVYMFWEEANNSKNRHAALMHNKFAILDEQLWTGSFNWTKSANQKNQENVIITTNRKVRQKFEHQFEILKQRCIALGASKPSKGGAVVQKSVWKAIKDLADALINK